MCKVYYAAYPPETAIGHCRIWSYFLHKFGETVGDPA